jgi:hypothetical protein
MPPMPFFLLASVAMVISDLTGAIAETPCQQGRSAFHQLRSLRTASVSVWVLYGRFSIIRIDEDTGVINDSALNNYCCWQLESRADCKLIGIDHARYLRTFPRGKTR